jgi:hypothetical protein
LDDLKDYFLVASVFRGMKKTNRLILLMVVVTTVLNGLVAQNWDWSTSFGGIGTDVLGAMKITEDGKLFIAGSYRENISFGTTNLTSTGQGDVFLAQLSESGNVQWAVSGGSESNDNSLALTLDADGNILWLGQYWVRAFFGTDSIDSGTNSKAYFLAKYSPEGELLWLQNIKGTSTKVVSDVCVASDNKIYLTGYFSDSLMIDDSVLTATAQEDAFVWKLDSDGEVVWGARFGESGMVRPVKIEDTPTGGLIIAGDIQGSVTFGGDGLNSVSTDFDIFAAKIDEQGLGIWGIIGTGVFDNFLRSLRVDEGGSIYLSGHFIGVLAMAENTIATPGFVDNLYLIKLDAAGDVTWIRALDDSEFNDPSFSFDIALSDDKVWMTGQFLETLRIDNLTINGAPYFQGFVAAFDTLDGAGEDLVLIPGDNQTSGRLVEVDANGLVYLGGVFVEGLTLEGSNYISNGETDIFLSSLGSDLTNVADQRTPDQRIKIYPNPIKETLNIYLPDDEGVEFECWDVLGVLHFRIKDVNSIDVGPLSPGLYYLVVRKGGSVVSMPFIKL